MTRSRAPSAPGSPAPREVGGRAAVDRPALAVGADDAGGAALDAVDRPRRAGSSPSPPPRPPAGPGSEPARRSSPNQATTRLTLSTLGALALQPVERHAEVGLVQRVPVLRHGLAGALADRLRGVGELAEAGISVTARTSPSAVSGSASGRKTSKESCGSRLP